VVKSLKPQKHGEKKDVKKSLFFCDIIPFRRARRKVRDLSGYFQFPNVVPFQVKVKIIEN